MKLSELKRLVDLCLEKDQPDAEVMIYIKLPYVTIGSIPMASVKSAQMGFDWEKGKFILMPEEELTPSDRDFAKTMKDMQDKLGWCEYENRNLKAEIKRLRKP